MNRNWIMMLTNGLDKDKYGTRWADLTAQGFVNGGGSFSDD